MKTGWEKPVSQARVRSDFQFPVVRVRLHDNLRKPGYRELSPLLCARNYTGLLGRRFANGSILLVDASVRVADTPDCPAAVVDSGPTGLRSLRAESDGPTSTGVTHRGRVVKHAVFEPVFSVTVPPSASSCSWFRGCVCGTAGNKADSPDFECLENRLATMTVLGVRVL
jgi:hypothetical protein